MDNVTYIKSFSKGQITVPKDVRESLGLGDDFWLKLYTASGKIIAEPVEQKKDAITYQKKLLSIKGRWFKSKEIAANRKQIEKRLSSRTL